jgi:hypothetical protein
MTIDEVRDRVIRELGDDKNRYDAAVSAALRLGHAVFVSQPERSVSTSHCFWSRLGTRTRSKSCETNNALSAANEVSGSRNSTYRSPMPCLCQALPSPAFVRRRRRQVSVPIADH